MNTEKTYKNLNYFYEYNMSTDKNPEKWCPCHILTSDPLHDFGFLKKDWCVYVYNAYGTYDLVKPDAIRKMSKVDYLKNRSQCMEMFSCWEPHHLGFHKNVEDDLKMYDQANALEYAKEFLADEDNIKRLLQFEINAVAYKNRNAYI